MKDIFLSFVFVFDTFELPRLLQQQQVQIEIGILFLYLFGMHCIARNVGLFIDALIMIRIIYSQTFDDPFDWNQYGTI
jgi:hypothetical protein